jgi:hypothetical protein
VSASKKSSGRVKNQNTSTSQIVVTPRYRANPRTEPTLRKNSTTDDSRATKLAAKIVFHVALNARGAALRSVRPLVPRPGALEEHDVRVDGDADRHDDAGGTGDRERVVGLREMYVAST